MNFIVKNYLWVRRGTKYSCESAIYFDLGIDTIKETCDFQYFDTHFITRSFSIFLWSILVMVTLAAYHTFGLKWIQSKVFAYRHTLFVVS